MNSSVALASCNQSALCRVPKITYFVLLLWSLCSITIPFCLVWNCIFRCIL